MDDMDLDTLLAVISNPTRRQILRKLVKETHYPLQLSRELNISQQAIMKHLRVLEENDLVRSMFMDSDSGPPRRCYVATKSLTLVIDLSPEMFSEELRFHEPGEVITAEADSQALSNAENLRLKLAEFMATIGNINEQLADLSEKRDSLITRKEEAMRYANDIIDTLCGDYEERKVLRYLIGEDQMSLDIMSEKLNMRESEVERVLRNLERKGLLMLDK